MPSAVTPSSAARSALFTGFKMRFAPCAAALVAVFLFSRTPVLRQGAVAILQQRAAAAEADKPRITDIVLITIDALRADRLGAYGYARRMTPNLDALAYRSLRFERVYTPTPHTSLAIGSLLTGRSLYGAIRLQPERTYATLPELLRKVGFHSAGFYPPAVFFTESERFSHYRQKRFGFEHAEVDYFDGKVGVDRAIAFLERTKLQRTFVWLHLLEPHEPYEIHKGYDFGSRDRERYDSEIAYADWAVGHLLDYLERTRPGAAIIVTADHGEAFDEHGARYHGTSLYEEQVRVPLIVRLPGQAARVVRSPVSLLDLSPTILSLAGTSLPAELSGLPLYPLADDKLAKRAVFAEFEALRMVVQGTRKLLCDITRGRCSVYDLSRDGKEQNDIAASAPDTLAALRPELDRFLLEEAQRYANKIDPAEPRWALIGRAQLGDRAVAPELLPLLQSTVPQPLRRSAARWLAELPVPPLAAGPLLTALRDSDGELAGWAAAAGSALRLPDAKNAGRKLVRRAATGSPLRTTLALVLGEQGDRAVVPAIIDLLPKCSEPLRCQRLVKILERLRDARAVPMLVTQIPRLDIRREVVDALGAIADPTTVPQLIECLLRDPYVLVRAAAARALGQMKDPAAQEALEQAAQQDSEARVVTEAKKAAARFAAKK